MAELGEAVAIGVVTTSEWKCPFGHDKKRTKLKNDLNGSGTKLSSRMEGGTSTCLWKEDAGPAIVAAEHAVKPRLKTAVTPPPVKVRLEVVDPIPGYRPANGLPTGTGKIARYSEARAGETPDGNYQYQMEAHHVIPSNVMGKTGLKDFLEDGAKIDGNVGYDVNGCENGVWLPGSKPPTSPLPGVSMALTLLIYYRAVMDRTNRQMHGKNLKAYDDFFKEKLEAIKTSLVAAPVAYACPDCQKIHDLKGKFPPPHTLVFRLNSLSGRIEKKLTGGSMNWMPPVIISKSASTYCAMSRAAALGGG